MLNANFWMPKLSKMCQQPVNLRWIQDALLPDRHIYFLTVSKALAWIIGIKSLVEWHKSTCRRKMIDWNSKCAFLLSLNESIKILTELASGSGMRHYYRHTNMLGVIELGLEDLVIWNDGLTVS